MLEDGRTGDAMRRKERESTPPEGDTLPEGRTDKGKRAMEKDDKAATHVEALGGEVVTD